MLTRPSYSPDFVHHDIVTNASGGKHATVTKVAGAGHLVGDTAVPLYCNLLIDDF